MAENRNASAQSVNDETFDGDSDVGRSSGMGSGYAPRATGTG